MPAIILTWKSCTGGCTKSTLTFPSSTVYRTVNLLEKKGILERHAFGRGRGRWEEATRDHHDHLIDIETGRVIEFHSADIEQLQEKIARELGFKLVGHRLELYGTPIAKKKQPRNS